MARIRTIKPEFFRHELLQDLEIANPGKYPMMVFAGLWGHCDSEGRFEWRPRQLKLDILPFIQFDMAEVLAILEGSNLIDSYEVDGKKYGVIGSFREHQRLSGKEAQDGAKHPKPTGETQVSTSEALGKQQGSTGEQQESQEGKGREGNGVQEWNGDSDETPSLPRKPKRATAYPADFYPNETGEQVATQGGVSIPSELEKFRDYHLARGSTMKDWQAAWRTWARNAAKFAQEKARPPPIRVVSGRQSAIDNYAAQAAAARGEGNGQPTNERDISGEAVRVA
jgi:hypothetical protein